MARKRIAFITVVLFLVQSLAFSSELLTGTTPLTPAEKVSLNKPEISFLKRYDIYILCMALFIYKLDVYEKFSKDMVKEELAKRFYDKSFDLSGIDFDLDKIDVFKKKGFTRYYPFYVHGNPYIIRIFRTDERHFQPDVEVLYEGNVDSPPVTFQILKGVNSILESCGMERMQISPQASAETSP